MTWLLGPSPFRVEDATAVPDLTLLVQQLLLEGSQVLSQQALLCVGDRFRATTS